MELSGFSDNFTMAPLHVYLKGRWNMTGPSRIYFPEPAKAEYEPARVGGLGLVYKQLLLTYTFRLVIRLLSNKRCRNQCRTVVCKNWIPVLAIKISVINISETSLPCVNGLRIDSRNS
ncbi:hypothetical protein J6590_051914 [Homalodisca vitripennis]|nr:hypothetical protein J6590_051914 [Homalodisca vitripennis]